ncbi:MAG: hypothetical protein HZA77_05760 [Candidatus Schekmanbacteria bacterium]|nr:hypothetical protein [Candidatus Schekmanbacteria bacterium]
MNIRNILVIVAGVLVLMVLPSTSFALTISGIVFNDVNCNGARSAGDSGIAGVTLILSPGAIVASTSATGQYTFSGLVPGTYIVTETDPSGYCSTTPNSRKIKLKNADVSGQHFGDSKKFVSPPGGCCP